MNRNNGFENPRKQTAMRTVDGILSTAVMVLAIHSYAEIIDAAPGPVTGALLAALAVCRLLRAFLREEPKKRVAQIIDLVIGVLFLAAAITVFRGGSPDVVIRCYAVAFFSSLLAGRITAILKNRPCKAFCWRFCGC